MKNTFEIGDSVWFVHHDRPVKMPIIAFSIFEGYGTTARAFYFGENIHVHEDDCFLEFTHFFSSDLEIIGQSAESINDISFDRHLKTTI